MMRRYGNLGGLLAVLWLALAMAGASPQLHHKLHEDASNPEHSCVIEHVSQGAVLFSPEPITTVSQPPAVSRASVFFPIFLFPRDFRVAFSRGPPSALAFRMVAG